MDDDCCAGSDSSVWSGRCANGFTRTETIKPCGHGYDRCENGCKEFTCKKSTSCVEYIGCYMDQTDAPDFSFKSTEIDPRFANGYQVSSVVSACSNQCRKSNYSFAAVQGAQTCWCGDSYGKYGVADERLCAKDENKGVAKRCGDGDRNTCLRTNAVYRLKGHDSRTESYCAVGMHACRQLHWLHYFVPASQLIANRSRAGTEKCCDYYEEYVPEHYNYSTVSSVSTLIAYLIVGVCCGLCWTVGPCIIGICAYLSHQKQQQRQQTVTTTTQVFPVAAVQPAMAIAQPAAVVMQPAQVSVQPAIPRAVSVEDVDPAAQKGGLVVVQPVSM